MVIPWFGASDIGHRRKSNQDCFAAFPELGLWILCDGMGGHAGGAEAAAAAVRAVAAAVRDGCDLSAAVAKAHLPVIRLGDELRREDNATRRPGTTVVALRADSTKYEIVWVGDSRAWRLSRDGCLCLTTDHSVVQDLVNWGDLTEAEARRHPQRHQLSQALGVEGRGDLQPGRISGAWNPEREVILLTSDGAVCHQMPDIFAKLLPGRPFPEFYEPEEIVTGMIEKSLALGGDDNVTALAVGRLESGPAAKFSGGRLFRRLRRRAAALFSGLLVPLIIFLLAGGVISAARPARAAMPSGDDLDRVCCEAADRLARDSGYDYLERVAVYFICPRGHCNLDSLNPQQLRESRDIALALQDALISWRDKFQVLQRDNARWAAVLQAEGDRGTLDGNDIMRVGRGLGARWIVTGEYWQSADGLFHLRARLFNGSSGAGAAVAYVDSSFTSSQRHYFMPLLFALAALLLLLVGGGAWFRLTRKRRQKLAKLEAGRRDAERCEELAQTLRRRDPGILDLSDDELSARLPPALQKVAQALKKPVGALNLDDNRGGRFTIAGGPEQGLGRGEKWLFSFSDPRISRAPQAFVKIDRDRPFIVHNRKVANPTLINGVEFAAQALVSGDEIALSSLTQVKVAALLPAGGIVLAVTSGPDSGRNFVIFNRKLSLADLFAASPQPETGSRLESLFLMFKHSRCLLLVDEGLERGQLTLRNENFTDELNLPLEPDSALLLADGDQLCDNSGRSLLTVGLTEKIEKKGV